MAMGTAGEASMEHLPHNGCDPAVDADGGDTPGYSDYKVALAKRL